MKKLLMLGLIGVLVFGAIPVLASSPAMAAGPFTINYGSVTLEGDFQSGNFADIWDITDCDLEIRFTYDANGLVEGGGVYALAQLGARQVGYGNFNPTCGVEGAGVWLAADFDHWIATNTFAPDDLSNPKWDRDDRLILQKAGGNDQGAYNLPKSLPLIKPRPINYGIWFDRDGVSGLEASMGGLLTVQPTTLAEGMMS